MRYETVRHGEEGYSVIDLHAAVGNRIVAVFYGEFACQNAKAFCSMKNLW
jgi:hypothetical protein